jgi:NAD(P)H-dependent flavin oxidoreductase YrpB (nitropropane dioxygenase family)
MSYTIVNKMKPLVIDSLIARVPIIQGGMGIGISLSGLAAAVANEGGIGVIATAGIGMSEPDFFKDSFAANHRALRTEIRKARESTEGILGVNIMVALTNFADLVKTAIEEGIDIIFSGAGLPLNLPELLGENTRTKLAPIVSSARAAAIIAKKWSDKFNRLPDAVVVEGPKAGGHLGFKEEMIDDPAYSLERLVPEVVEAMKPFEEKHAKAVPVIAAGGIYTGQDIYRFFQLGASGVQMATRFVTTHECDASLKFKQAYIDSGKEDMVIIKSPVGMPGRAIKNSFIDEVSQGKRKPFKCPYHCLKTCDVKNSPYCITLALINAKKGNLSQGFAFAGANAYRADKIISVKELIETLLKEYNEVAA